MGGALLDQPTMKLLKLYILLICGLSLSFLSVHAQEADYVSIKFQLYLLPGAEGLEVLSEESVAPKSTVHRLLQDVDRPYFIYYKGSGDTYERVKVYAGLISGSFRYRGPSRLQFYAKRPSSAEESQYVPFGSVDIAASSRELTFFVMGNGEGGCRVLPVDTSLASIPSDKVAISNLTQSELACSLMQDPFKIQPMSIKLMDLKMDGVYQPVLIASRGVNGAWERRLVRKLTVSPSNTKLWIIYNRDGNPDRFGLLKISGIGHAKEPVDSSAVK